LFRDRRTIIKKVGEGKLRDLIDALKELFREDRKLEAVLREFSLL